MIATIFSTFPQTTFYGIMSIVNFYKFSKIFPYAIHLSVDPQPQRPLYPVTALWETGEPVRLCRSEIRHSQFL